MNRFDYTQNFSKLDFRKNPELYRVGVGEQGVLLVQPYKSELVSLWRFKTPQISSVWIWLANIYKWGTRVQGDTQITTRERNI